MKEEEMEEEFQFSEDFEKIKQLLLPYSDRTIQLIFMCVKVIKENDI